MRRLACLLLPLLAATAAADGETEARRAERLAHEAALRAEVPQAVARGVAWLWTQQREDGAFATAPRNEPGVVVWGGHEVGRCALAALALLHAGVDREDARLQRAFAFLRRRWRAVAAGDGAAEGATYSLSLLAMALHARYAPPGELPEGATPENPCGLSAIDLSIVRAIGRWLVETRVKDSLFGYPTPPQRALRGRRLPRGMEAPPRVDMSNTQYALLGLWACGRCGVAVPRSDLVSIAQRLLAAQARGGPAERRRLDPAPGADPTAHVYAGVTDRARGFGYAPVDAVGAAYVTGSMTAGGLSSLLIAKALLAEQEQLDERLTRRLDHGIWDAIAWLARHFRVDRVPGALDLSGLPVETAKLLGGQPLPDAPDAYFGYYLYGLERAMVIAGKRYLGGHDWYLEGARVLLDRQAPDGHWPKPAEAPPTPGGGLAMPPMPIADTCFALLFLQRATLRPRAPLIDVRPPAER